MSIIERRRLLLATAGLALASRALAHGKKEHADGLVRKEQTAWGIAAEPAKASRKVSVRMSDAMRFTPDRLEVKLGETLHFIVHNDGRLIHEFVIGTQATLDEHAAMMQKFPDMEHDEPYMAHVAPGQRRELVWTFNRPGDFSFACLIAGHYEAGMVGKISVTPGKEA